jgi:hypothetical protein
LWIERLLGLVEAKQPLKKLFPLRCGRIKLGLSFKRLVSSNTDNAYLKFLIEKDITIVLNFIQQKIIWENEYLIRKYSKRKNGILLEAKNPEYQNIFVMKDT